MKISNSKKHLAKIISENGGWREGAAWAAIEQQGGNVWLCARKPHWNVGVGIFSFKDHVKTIPGRYKLPNIHQTILSRDEYFHLYPAPDADGWIEWNGGECPVQLGTLVDVKYTNGITNIGVSALTTKAHEGHVSGSAGSLLATNWSYDLPMSAIIAYRLHKPERENPESCEPVMSALIGVDMASGSDSTALFTVNAKPTIEQLAADYRNAKDFAERKQEEADDASADAEAKLAELVAAGKAIGLVLSVASPEPELVITDWRDLRVGDVIEVTGSSSEGWQKVKGKELTIKIVRSDGASTGEWLVRGNTEFRLIRRP